MRLRTVTIRPTVREVVLQRGSAISCPKQARQSAAYARVAVSNPKKGIRALCPGVGAFRNRSQARPVRLLIDSTQQHPTHVYREGSDEGWAVQCHSTSGACCDLDGTATQQAQMMTKDGDREKERKRQRAIGELPYPSLPFPLPRAVRSSGVNSSWPRLALQRWAQKSRRAYGGTEPSVLLAVDSIVHVCTVRIHEEWRQQMLWNSTVACTLHCAQ